MKLPVFIILMYSHFQKVLLIYLLSAKGRIQKQPEKCIREKKMF